MIMLNFLTIKFQYFPKNFSRIMPLEQFRFLGWAGFGWTCLGFDLLFQHFLQKQSLFDVFFVDC
jgi:apolipoprotein N-acyltransferase